MLRCFAGHDLVTPGALVLHWPTLGDTTKNARVDARAAATAHLNNVAVAGGIVRRSTHFLSSLPAASPLEFTTNTNVAVAMEIVRSARVAFLSVAENGAAQNNF